MDITPDKFVKLVVDSYDKGKGVFKNKVNAEDLIPKNTTDFQKSLFLFYTTQLDYATKSQKLYQGAKLLFQTDKNFFDPFFIQQVNENTLKTTIQKHFKPRYINEAVRRFKLNSNMLIDNYEGNPLKLFKNAKTAQEAIKSIRKFRGFGPKIGNFYFRTMVNTFNFKYPDIEDVLPPVDVHDVRIAFLMGYVKSQEMTQANIKTVKNLWNQACIKAKRNWLTFDKALWLLGSEGKPKTKVDVINLLV